MVARDPERQRAIPVDLRSGSAGGQLFGLTHSGDALTNDTANLLADYRPPS
jgi:hypothetical protein